MLFLAETAAEAVNGTHDVGENRDLRMCMKMPGLDTNGIKQAGTRSYRPDSEPSQLVLRSGERGILRFTRDLNQLTISQLVSKVVSWSV